MGKQNLKNCFELEVLTKMDEFERNFLRNGYTKDLSGNDGCNYREAIVQEDKNMFEEYLDSEYSADFLNLK